MKSENIKVVHYINQFFGGIGGEDKAYMGPSKIDGPVGPGKALQQALEGQGEVVGTVICGDNYFSEQIQKTIPSIVEMILSYRPDAILAGPAFDAGRYGIACVSVCQAVSEKLGIPAVTGLYRENPGLDISRQGVYIVETSNSVRGMAEAVKRMVRLTSRLANNENMGKPSEEGYFPRGILIHETVEKPGAERAISMLLAKLAGREFTTEVPLPGDRFGGGDPAPAIRALSSASIALITDGGLVPRGNPDRIESKAATRFGAYCINDVNCLEPDEFEVVHVGYDSGLVSEDPHRLVPLDIMHDLEKEGIIGKTYEKFYSTVGVATSSAHSKKMGRAMAEELKEAGVSGAILTST